MTEKPTRSEEPVDDLGFLANALISTAETYCIVREIGEKRLVLFIEDDDRAMTALSGWDSDTHAMAAVLLHLTKVFEANGKTLKIVPLGRG